MPGFSPRVFVVFAALAAAANALAQAPANGCASLPKFAALKAALTAATAAETSGLNNQMWGPSSTATEWSAPSRSPARRAIRNGPEAASFRAKGQHGKRLRAGLFRRARRLRASLRAWRYRPRISIAPFNRAEACTDSSSAIRSIPPWRIAVRLGQLRHRRPTRWSAAKSAASTYSAADWRLFAAGQKMVGGHRRQRRHFLRRPHDRLAHPQQPQAGSSCRGSAASPATPCAPTTSSSTSAPTGRARAASAIPNAR